MGISPALRGFPGCRTLAAKTRGVPGKLGHISHLNLSLHTSTSMSSSPRLSLFLSLSFHSHLLSTPAVNMLLMKPEYHLTQRDGTITLEG